MTRSNALQSPPVQGQAVVGSTFSWLEHAQCGCISGTGLTGVPLGELNEAPQ